ncbi:hypothetical protein DFP72DRAFT_925410 [Ephemerocybe angulata]|uniref:Uncharacterized protein n=1 Tax=Ephemerocybe angulata TaxID=980116 RepID=A0A8H6HFW4_9AGAR|nr:hypothetical protein DFP72DRAFT_925410 [Tulosesus angulatus]
MFLGFISLCLFLEVLFSVLFRWLFSFVAAHIRIIDSCVCRSRSLSRFRVSWFSSHRTILASPYHPFIHSFIYPYTHSLSHLPSCSVVRS